MSKPRSYQQIHEEGRVCTICVCNIRSSDVGQSNTSGSSILEEVDEDEEDQDEVDEMQEDVSPD